MNMEYDKCTNCSGELTWIKLIGRGWENPLTGAAIETDLAFYREADTKRNTFTGKFGPKSSVDKFLCNSCGRIFFLRPGIFISMRGLY
jgi:hypothetical protein